MKHLFSSCLCHESQGLYDWKPSSVSSRTWSTSLVLSSPQLCWVSLKAPSSSLPSGPRHSPQCFLHPASLPPNQQYCLFYILICWPETNRLSAISPAKLDCGLGENCSVEGRWVVVCPCSEAPMNRGKICFDLYHHLVEQVWAGERERGKMTGKVGNGFA